MKAEEVRALDENEVKTRIAELEEERPSAKVIDLTELLRQSLRHGTRKAPRKAAGGMP